jgi:hypothetical protein
MGDAFNAGFTALAMEIAKWALGAGTLAIVALGIGTILSIFDRGVMSHVKDGLLRVIGGCALAGGASIVATFIVANFHF